MRHLSVIRNRSLTERNKTDTCPLTRTCNRPNNFFVEKFFTNSLPSILRTYVIAALTMTKENQLSLIKSYYSLFVSKNVCLAKIYYFHFWKQKLNKEIAHLGKKLDD